MPLIHIEIGVQNRFYTVTSEYKALKFKGSFEKFYDFLWVSF
jgi:hypothetical protein